VTVADLEEQFQHNLTMRAMVAEVGELARRVQGALEGASGTQAQRLQAVADKLLTNRIRYSQPGLQTQISYLAGMTSRVDQKIGRDAIARYRALRAELDQITAEVNAILGSGG